MADMQSSTSLKAQGRHVVHLDLFSGIGGFAYAIDHVWSNVQHIFCDNDKFCRAILNKHWPESEVYEDIKDITNTTIERVWKVAVQRQPHQENPNADRRVDILTGGFPCQPFSAAGLRRGTADERHLWPEMLRVIQLTHPTWIIAENVRGLITWNDGLVFESVCADLEAEGYEVQPLIIPAVAVDAPHRRDRVWVVAHTQNVRHKRRSTPERWDSQGEQERDASRDAVIRENPRPEWDADWPEVATSLCGVDDGLSVELDGLKLTKPQHKNGRLKGLGNAIVPQVAIELLRCIDLAFPDPEATKGPSNPPE